MEKSIQKQNLSRAGSRDFSTRLRLARNDILKSFQHSNQVQMFKMGITAQEEYIGFTACCKEKDKSAARSRVFCFCLSDFGGKMFAGCSILDA